MAGMELLVLSGGTVRCIYGEELELSTLGELQITRASHVEPVGQQWQADLSPVGGPVLGPFGKRSLALQAEQQWLSQHLAQLPRREAR